MFDHAIGHANEERRKKTRHFAIGMLRPPRSPAGHRARLAVRKAWLRSALPIRLPGKSDELVLGGPDRRYWTADVEVGQTLMPPSHAGARGGLLDDADACQRSASDP